MELIKVHYRTKEGCFMDTLGCNEVDPTAPIIEKVFKVKTKTRVYHNKEARKYLKQF